MVLLIIFIFCFLVLLYLPFVTHRPNTKNCDSEKYKLQSHQLTPKHSMSYMAQHHVDLLNNIYVKTRKEFEGQHHEASNMFNGFHTLLPDNAKWVDGVVEISDDIRKERENMMAFNES